MKLEHQLDLLTWSSNQWKRIDYCKDYYMTWYAYYQIIIFSGYVSVLIAAVQYNKDLTWALQRLAELGLEVGPKYRKDVLKTYKAILDKENINRTGREEL